jgi:hypothetical protein
VALCLIGEFFYLPVLKVVIDSHRLFDS